MYGHSEKLLDSPQCVDTEEMWERFSSPFSEGGIELKKKIIRGKVLTASFSGTFFSISCCLFLVASFWFVPSLLRSTFSEARN